MKSFTIGPNDAGQRLDKFIQKAVPTLPKGLMYKYIRTKRIKTNGKRANISMMLSQGDVVEMYINDEFFSQKRLDFLDATPNLDIVYEDGNILLANKPSGVVVHGKGDTMQNRLLHSLYVKKEFLPGKEQSYTPAFVNRIDRNTSGIIIAAKNFPSAQVLSQKIREHEINKYYLCQVMGTPSPLEATLTGFLIKDTNTNQVKITEAPLSGAKEVATHYKVLYNNKNRSIVEVELLTGRSHQIRAHMASIGHPIVGDTKYGYRCKDGGKNNFLALCSYKVQFNFCTDSGHLNYLNGKIFSLTNIPF